MGKLSILAAVALLAATLCGPAGAAQPTAPIKPGTGKNWKNACSPDTIYSCGGSPRVCSCTPRR